MLIYRLNYYLKWWNMKIKMETSLITLCAMYLVKKKHSATVWDLINTMHLVLEKVDYINKNSSIKKVDFYKDYIEVEEQWMLDKFGERRNKTYNKVVGKK